MRMVHGGSADYGVRVDLRIEEVKFVAFGETFAPESVP